MHLEKNTETMRDARGVDNTTRFFEARFRHVFFCFLLGLVLFFWRCDLKIIFVRLCFLFLGCCSSCTPSLFTTFLAAFNSKQPPAKPLEHRALNHDNARGPGSVPFKDGKSRLMLFGHVGAFLGGPGHPQGPLKDLAAS